MAQLRDMCFKRTDLGTLEKHLNSDSMKLLQHFDGRTPFHQIQQLVGLPAAVFKSSFLELFQKIDRGGPRSSHGFGRTGLIRQYFCAG